MLNLNYNVEEKVIQFCFRDFWTKEVKYTVNFDVETVKEICVDLTQLLKKFK